MYHVSRQRSEADSTNNIFVLLADLSTAHYEE